MKREIIVQLIAEDILHNQLLNGLNNIGLMDSERYTLNIVSIIADMMGIPRGKISDIWLQTYHEAMLNIPNNLTTEERHSRANNLLVALTELK